MNLNPDLVRKAALDRQQRLRAEAAASRLASVQARSRMAHFLRRAANRLDAATASSCQVCDLAERG